MRVNDVELNAELADIIEELQRQLVSQQINLLSKVKDSGEDIMVCCPYHKGGQERKPSAGIRKSDGLFHCFACGETHTLPEVISHCFGEDATGNFGWKWLIRTFGTVRVEDRKDVVLDFIRSPNNNVGNNDKRNNYISKQELDSYRYIHPYMYERKLTDDIIEIFDIGYDKKTDCITFPVRDINGNTLAIARRSTKGKYFNYPSGFEKPLYGIYELYLCAMNNIADSLPPIYADTDTNDIYISKERVFPLEVIVCESMIDALTCWVYGKYAVALNGLGTELQFKQLRELPCRKIILATDNDKAGMSARKRIRNNVKNKIVTEYILPSGKKDINELTKEEFDNLEEIF